MYIKETKNQFRHFKGFGIQGHYMRHARVEPVKMLRELLSANGGKKVILRYEKRRYKDWEYEIWKRKHDDPTRMFIPHEDRITIPKNNTLDNFLSDLHTDNITVEIPSEKKVYEIQKIYFVGDFVTELRVHNKYNHEGMIYAGPFHTLKFRDESVVKNETNNR